MTLDEKQRTTRIVEQYTHAQSNNGEKKRETFPI